VTSPRIDSRPPAPQFRQTGAQPGHRLRLRFGKLRQAVGDVGQNGIRRLALRHQPVGEVDPVRRRVTRGISAFFLQFVDQVRDLVDFQAGDAGAARVLQQVVDVAQVEIGKHAAKCDKRAENDGHQKAKFHECRVRIETRLPLHAPSVPNTGFPPAAPQRSI
jgi:hypothetical protein